MKIAISDVETLFRRRSRVFQGTPIPSARAFGRDRHLPEREAARPDFNPNPAGPIIATHGKPWHPEKFMDPLAGRDTGWNWNMLLEVSPESVVRLATKMVETRLSLDLLRKNEASAPVTRGGNDFLRNMTCWLPIPAAQAKDGGWEQAVVAMLLDGLNTDELPVCMIRQLALSDLEAFLQRLRLAISNLALPPA